MSGALSGRTILVTRPAALAGSVCDMLERQGAETVRFPALEILPPGDTERFRRQLAERNLSRAQLAIFISPTAVEMAWPALEGAWPATVPLAAVGTGTAAALRARGAASVIHPTTGSDSEALASMPQLHLVSGKTVLIIRGEGGRDWLAQTLRSRGAQVEYVECYRRSRPGADPAPLALRWLAGGISAVVVTSIEALDNLVAMLPPEVHQRLFSTPLFAPHERIAVHARRLGVECVVVTGSGDKATVEGIQCFFAKV